MAVSAQAGAVGFLGPLFSYSHQAAIQAFPGDQWHLQPVATIADIFHQVQSQQVLAGVVPIENSINGCVNVTLELLAGRDANVKVERETVVQVNHCLAKRKDLKSTPQGCEAPDAPSAASTRRAKPAYPLGKLGNITKLLSHPQAFGQCMDFISTYLRDVQRLGVNSTSQAAEIVSKDATGTMAAISSELAAEHYELEILAKLIQDSEDNKTRFLVIGANRSVSEDPNLLSCMF